MNDVRRPAKLSYSGIPKFLDGFGSIIASSL
jgi:hypothetical protein